MGMNGLSALPVSVQTFGLLLLSNLFMTFAWYGHLKHQVGKAWYVPALVSWGVALFESLLQRGQIVHGFNLLFIAHDSVP